MKANPITLTLAAALLASACAPSSEDLERMGKLDAADTTPQEYATLTVYEPKADVETERNGRSLSITLNLYPWLLTKGTAETAFQVNLERLIPGVFYKYHDIDSITVIGTCTFKDKKGHESHGNAMRAKFTRDNSESINWGNISLSDLPAIADDYWVHP